MYPQVEIVALSAIMEVVFSTLRCQGGLRDRLYIEEKGLDAGQFLQSLLETRLLYLDHTRNLWFLTDECAVARLPDGRIVAGENNSGRFLRWVKQFEAEYRSARGRDTTDH